MTFASPAGAGIATNVACRDGGGVSVGRIDGGNDGIAVNDNAAEANDNAGDVTVRGADVTNNAADVTNNAADVTNNGVDLKNNGVVPATYFVVRMIHPSCKTNFRNNLGERSWQIG